MPKCYTCLLILFLLTATPDANAWSKKDTYYEVAYLVTHAVDWSQTSSISDQCVSGAFYETNPVMGDCPSSQVVDTYFVTTAILHYGVTHMLHPKYRRMFQVATIGMELSYIANNASIGVNMKF